MKVIIQRSEKSCVIIKNKIYSQIEKGLVLFVGFTHKDDEDSVDKVIKKIINLRIFKDEKGLTNLGIKEIKGSILSVSQFTLYANVLNGRRPSFTDAMEAQEAQKLYELFNKKLKAQDIEVKTGVFGASMLVNITNDGPFTIVIDSSEM